MKISLGREDGAGESAGDYDDDLGMQPDLDDLLHEQAPPNLVRNNGADGLARQDHDVADIDSKGNGPGAYCGDEACQHGDGEW